jgi:hypothetical protein
MAIYIEHNLTENFINAVGYDDKFMQAEILIDEIARLIVDDKRFVVRLLRSQNINVTIRNNNEKIADALLRNIDNPVILKKLSSRIADEIDTDYLKQKNNQYQNLFGIGKNKTEKTPKQKKEKSGAVKNLLSKLFQDEEIQENVGTMIGTSIKKAFQKKKTAKKGAAKITNSDILKERLKINEMQNSKKKKPFPQWAKIAIISTASVGVVLTIVLIVSKLKKKRYTPSISQVSNS